MTFCLLNLLAIIILVFGEGTAQEWCITTPALPFSTLVGAATYDPTSVQADRTVCQNECFSQNLTFSAVWKTYYCFCGNNMSATVNISVDCATSDGLYVMAASTTSVSAVLDLNVGSSPFVAGNSMITLTPSILMIYTPGISIGYQYSYRDRNNIWEYNIAATGIQRAMVYPGVYEIRCQIVKQYNLALIEEVAKQFIVYQSPTNVNLTCPSYHVIYLIVTCQLTMTGGSLMTGSINVNGSLTETVTLTDTYYERGGSVPNFFNSNFITSLSLAGINVANSVFQYAGTVSYIELNAVKASAIDLLLLQPDCPSSFCFATSQCGSTPTCSSQLTCTANIPYCSVTRSCSDVCNNRLLKYENVTTLPVNYKIIQSYLYTIPSIGYQIVSLPSAWTVNAGYRLAFHSQTLTDVIATTVPRSTESVNFFVSSHTVAIGTSLTSFSSVNAQHQLSAVATPTLTYNLRFMFNNTGPTTVQLALSSNSQSVASVSSIINIGLNINDTNFTAPFSALTSAVKTIKLLPLTGINLQFYWNFGDGTSLNTTEPTVNKTFSTKGTYNVSVIVFNAFVNRSNSVYFIVKDPVVIGSFTGAGITGPNTVINFSVVMTSGDDYQCTLSGDSFVNVTKPNGSLSFSGSWANTGFFNLRLDCYSDVSQSFKLWTQVIMTSITGLAFTRLGGPINVPTPIKFQWTTGSNISFEFLFNNVTLNTTKNETMLVGFSDNVLVLTPSNVVGVIRAKNTLSEIILVANLTFSEPIVGLKISSNNLYVALNSAWVFTVVMTSGSSVNIIIDFKDGTNTTSNGPDLVSWPNTYSYNHTFSVSGQFNVTVTANNTAGTEVASFVVYCITPLGTYTGKTNANFVKIGDPSLFSVVRTSGSPAVMTNISVNWDDGSIIFANFSQFNESTTYSHSYAANRPYNITATLMNPLNTVVAYSIVHVINPITNFRCSNLPLNTWSGGSINYTAIIDSGDFINLTFTPGSGGAVQQGSLNATSLNTPYTFPHTYSAVGNYTPNITACSPLGCQSCAPFIQIQNKVIRTEFALTSNEFIENIIQNSTINITFSGATFPTAITLTFNYFDGSAPVVISPVPSFLIHSQNKNLSKTGYLNVSVTISNLANSETYYVQVGAFDKFVGFAVSTKWGPTRSSGLGPTQSIFPLQQVIYFSPSITGKGTVVNYTFMYVPLKNVNNIYSCNATIINGEFGYTFNTSGDYNISMIAVNPISNTYISLVLTIGGSMKDTAIIPPTFTLYPNYFGYVLITWSVIAPDACICVNLGNGTNVIYGAKSGCTNCSSAIYTNIQPVNNQIKMTVKYPVAGDYNIGVYVYNSLESTYVNRTIPITSIQCSLPIVSMTTMQYSISDTPQTGLRGSQIIVNSLIIDLPCQVTKENFKMWSAVMVDSLYLRTIKTIDLSSIPTSNNTQLIIPPLFLEYGLYRLTFTVVMDRNKTTYTFLNMSTTYLSVVKSPIIVGLSAGGTTLFVRGTQQLICLYPMNYSKDPDISVQNFNGWTWVWKCRHINESENLNKTVSPKPIGFSFPTPKTGCFGDGPGMVNFSSSTPCFHGSNMDTKNTYLMELNGNSPDNRMGSTKLNLQIVDGIPPTISIQCMRQFLCNIKQDGPFPFAEVAINPSDILLLNASCIMSTGLECIAGLWNIQVQYNTSQYNTSTFVALESSDINLYLKGIQSLQMIILPDLFAKYPNLSRFQACYSGGDNSSVGLSCIQFFVNPLPLGVICSLDKAVISQTDTVCCNCSFSTGFNYRIFVNASGQLTTLGFSTNGTFCSIIPYQLVSQTYIVRVTNMFGGFVDYNVAQVQVQTLDPASLANILSGLLNGTDQTLQMINAKGDFKTMAQIYLQYISVVTVSNQNMMKDIFGSATNGSKLNFGGSSYTQNTVVQGGLTIDDLSPAKREAYENDRDSKSQIVNLMTSNLVNMVPADIQSLHLVSSVITAISSSFDCLNRQGQNDVSNKLAKLALNLKTMQATASRDDIQKISTSLLTATFQSDAASNSQISNGIKRDIKQSKDNFLDYDTNLESSKGSFMNVANFDDASNMLTKETNSDFQSTVSLSFGVNSVYTINTVSKVLRDNTVVGDEPIQLSSPQMQYYQQKSLVSSLSGAVYNKGRSSITLPDVCEALGTSDCSNPNKAVSLEIIATPNNVRAAVVNPHSNGIPIPLATDLVSLSLYSGSNENEKSLKVKSPQPFKITLSRDPSFKIPDFTVSDPNVSTLTIAPPQIIPGTGSLFTGPLYYAQKLVMHQFTLNGSDQSVHFQMQFPYKINCTQFLVVGRLLNPPSLGISPDGTVDEDGGFVVWGMIPTNTKFCNVAPTVNDSDPFTFYINNTYFNVMKLNVTNTQPSYSKVLNYLYFGVRELRQDEWNLYTPNNRPPYPYPYSDQINTTYKVRIYSSGCFSNSDGFKSAWTTSNCTVGPLTTPMMTQCICTHLTTFVSGFIVAPNTINFNYIFSNFDLSKNSTLFITEGVIFLVFIVIMVWARRKDIKDLEKIGVTPLADNDPSDMYLYEIIVDTSMRNNAGTKSKVYFILSGESDETEARLIDDSKRSILQRGSIDHFLLAVPRTLGPLQYIRLWHDNSGKGQNASWNCNYFGVIDLQTKEKFHFLVNSWFAVEEDDGQVDRLIAVAGSEELLVFGELFARKMKHDLSENHLWLSIMARPPESRFTRLERVASCMLLMFLTMLTTCMFYRQDGPSKVTDNALIIGPLAITPREVWIGLVSGIIGFLPMFIIIEFFRRSQLKHGHANKLREAVEDHLQIAIDSGDNKGTMHSRATLVNNEEPIPQRLNTPGFRAPDQVDIQISEPDLKAATAGPVEKSTRKRLFPWWVRIFVWIFLVVLLIVACFFTTMYGIQFGDMACKKWISSMFISFFASVILIQPIKVIVLAIFFSLICKKASSVDDNEFVDEEDELMNELGQRNGLMLDEEYLHGDLYTAPVRPHRKKIEPPSKDDIEKAREFRLKEMKMFDVIREIAFYLIFFTTLLLVTYSFRDPNSYNLKTEFEKVFINPWNPDWRFGDIRREDQFWDWALNVLVPALRAPLWYNNQPQVYQRGFISDRNNRLMGYAVMRQVRIKPKSCTIYSYVKNIVKNCYGTYNMFTEDKANYSIGWKVSNTTDEEYTYQTATKLSGMPYLGSMNVYSGGGYVYQFRANAAKLFQEMSILRDSHWIDFYTRAILIEFTTYNPNINLFAICTFLLELPGSGGMWPSYRIEPANLLGVYSSGVTAFEIFCQVLYGFFIFFMIIKEIRNVMRQKWSYIKQFWNWVEIVLIGGSFACVAAFIYIRVGTGQLTEQFKNTAGDSYMKFQFVAFWNEYMGYLTSFIVFAATLKFIKLFRFNRRIGMLGSVLSYCSRDMKQFFIIFMIMFLAFVMVFYCLFMDSLFRYHTFLHSTESSMQIALGKFAFLELYQREPIFGPIVFACYVIFIIFVMINMFVAILEEGLGAVRADIDLQSNEFEVVDFIMTKFIIMTGITNTKFGHKFIKTSVTDQMYKEIDERELMAKVNSFPDKVDQLLSHINHIVGSAEVKKRQKKGFSDVIFETPKAPPMKISGNEYGFDEFPTSRPSTATSNILRPRSAKEMPAIEK